VLEESSGGVKRAGIDEDMVEGLMMYSATQMETRVLKSEVERKRLERKFKKPFREQYKSSKIPHKRVRYPDLQYSR